MRLPSVPRATATGFACAAGAILLWLAVTGWPELFVIPYVVALAATFLCGAYVLLATAYDAWRNPRRGVRIRPIRGFDLFAGLILAGPALWTLWPFLRVF